jgi:hypothetical protein
MLRRACLTTLLVTSALAMSGCWGRVAGPTGGHQVLVIKPGVSDRIILDATIRADGGGHARGVWALETIRGLCYNVPLSTINPISRAYCLSITWSDHPDDIEGAIRQVLTPGYDCLAATMGDPDPDIGWGDWFALPRGAYGCAD